MRFNPDRMSTDDGSYIEPTQTVATQTNDMQTSTVVDETDERQTSILETKTSNGNLIKALEALVPTDVIPTPTTKAPVVSTTKAPVVSTTKAPVVSTTKAPVVSTTKTTSPTNNLITSGSVVPNPTPITPALSLVAKTPPPPPVKTAPIDTVLFNDDSMSIEIMADLIFEDIGGHELINIARNDIINGQQVSYTPIKNLGLIQQTYNPNNILRLQSTSEKYFANFAIKLEEKIPLVGNGPNGSNVYIDPTTGDLIIEGININKDELFEVELSLNGTIYEANFGATTS